MYTVTVDADRMWISDPADPSSYVQCGTRQSSPADNPLDGEVRYYAGGRAQGVVRTQDVYTRPLTLAHLSQADQEQVTAWRGKVVLVRTVEGSRFFAVYFNATVQRVLRTNPENGYEDYTFDVDVTFTRVSYDESV